MPGISFLAMFLAVEKGAISSSANAAKTNTLLTCLLICRPLSIHELSRWYAIPKVTPAAIENGAPIKIENRIPFEKAYAVVNIQMARRKG